VGVERWVGVGGEGVEGWKGVDGEGVERGEANRIN
jgi:hypothetical protein